MRKGGEGKGEEEEKEKGKKKERKRKEKGKKRKGKKPLQQILKLQIILRKMTLLTQPPPIRPPSMHTQDGIQTLSLQLPPIRNRTKSKTISSKRKKVS